MPYTVRFGPLLTKQLAEYYGDEHWQQKKLRQFISHYLDIDICQMRPMKDERYSKDAFGAIWRMDKHPWHLETPPLSQPSLDGYVLPSPNLFIDQVLKDKPESIQKYNDDTEHYRIITMGWGIFENSWRIRGFENALTDTIADEDFYMELCEKITDIYLAVIRTCEDVPAEAYFFGDDWGDQRGVIMGPERWRKFIKPCWAKIYAEARRQGKKTLHHCCGSVVDIYDDMIEIGLDCHESVQPEAFGMTPEELKAKWGNRISFWGCLGSQSILTHGTPKEISTEIKRLHTLFKNDGGYILSPAKPLMDGMDIGRAVAVIETLAELSL